MVRRIILRTVSILAQFLIALYVIIGHFAKLIFYMSGLKIKYINHKPWPYKAMWEDWKDLGND